MGEEKGKLLYTATGASIGFMNAIASQAAVNYDYESITKNRIEPADRGILHQVRGVVLVGPQTSRNRPDKAVFESVRYTVRCF